MPNMEPEKPHASVAVPPAPVWFPSQSSLAPSQLRLKVNDMGVNEMIPGLFTDFLAFA